MAERDYYEILGVSRNASASELKSSYKRLARKYHPDNKETGDENLFKELGEAYAVLSDPQKRTAYDRMGHAAFVGGARGGRSYGAPFDGGGDLFDQVEQIFDVFFGGSGGGFAGGSRGRKPRERGADLQKVLELEFLEAAFGVSKKIKVTRTVTCVECAGSGADPDFPPKTCPTCQGTGELKKTTQSFLGTITQITSCPTCKGQGTVITQHCRACKGSGSVQQNEELEAQIPKGVEEGMRVLLSGKGNHGRHGGPPGDLYLLIKVKPHSTLRREGLDIWQELPITVWQAILGDRVMVETIHSQEPLEIKPGTQSGTVLTLSGEGIHLDNGKMGDHHVQLSVRVPHKKDLPKEVLSLVEELAQTQREESDAEGSSLFHNLFKRPK